MIEQLKKRAKDLGLWNIWLSKDHYAAQGGFMTNLEYAVCAEIMGRAIRIAPEACNASAPDTGNMGQLLRSPSLPRAWISSKEDCMFHHVLTIAVVPFILFLPLDSQRFSRGTGTQRSKRSGSNLFSRARRVRRSP